MRKLLTSALVLVLTVQTYAQDVAGARAKLLEALTLLEKPTPGQTTHVAAGGDLQAAITAAKCGDTITLERGTRYLGSYILPRTGCDERPITIRTEGNGSLPEPGTRMDPTQFNRLASLRSPTNDPALRTVAGADGWRLELLAFEANRGGVGDIIRLGDGSENQQTFDQVPHHLTLDRLLIQGDPILGQKRGIALNAREVVVINSYISDIKAVGQDSQAIMLWNGAGPVTIANNYLEGAGENLMVGGADAARPELLPRNVVILGNVLTKPLAWRSQLWSVKNLLELKAGLDVTIKNNVLSNVWLEADRGQAATALVITVRNQDGTAPFTVIAQVLVEGNIFSHMGGGIQILGRDDGHPSGVLEGLMIRLNTFDDIDPQRWGGAGRQVFLAGGPHDVTLETNTFSGAHLNTFLSFGEGPFPVVGLKVFTNHAYEGDYGIIGSGGTPGIRSLEQFAPGYEWKSNTITRTVPANRIPYPDVTTIVLP